MGYLPFSQFGKCALCGTDNVNCVKVKKELHCIPCHRGNKTTIQIQKANQRDRDRAAAVKALPKKQKQQIKRQIKSSIRSLNNSNNNLEILGKAKLLKLCDAAFSRYIRNRDTHNGKVTCICCKKVFDADAVDKDGQRIIQNLHFVKRSVYSLRFDEYNNCNAGCTWCNNDMNKNSFGVAYQQYRQTLVERIGESEVALMELEHRKINRLEEAQLRVILEHYQI